jgi:hypothetical protein
MDINEEEIGDGNLRGGERSEGDGSGDWER